jgi:aromatic-L-amino-acid/L-tryptophan decarboxylase
VTEEETLDPADWDEFARVAHAIVDDAIAYTKGVRDRPVWQPVPEAIRAGFQAPVPREPTPLAELRRELNERLMPYPMGNIHPRFWMWYMGASNLTGALGDFLAAVNGSNLGGGNHAAALLDQQVVDWLKQLLGFPPGASGTLVSGGSVANLIGLTVARNAMAGVMDGLNLREEGVGALTHPLRFYGSDQIHSCHQKAVETLGLGNRALRRIPTGADCRLDLAALERAIAEDRAAGWQPACVIATAGTVNTGAVDDLAGVARLCRERKLWMHVDGCIGALGALAPRHRGLLAGLEAADSVALDPHKWLHAPFDVGCVILRDPQAHLRAFSLTPEYLERTARGIASGAWLFDYGLQTSRGFRALKVWMALKEQGADKFGRIIDLNIDQARYFAERLSARPDFELVASVTLDIVCFRYRPPGLTEAAVKPLNTEIMLRLQEAGIAALSDTTVHGIHCLRAAIANHRTRREDIDLVIDAIARIGPAISSRQETTNAIACSSGSLQCGATALTLPPSCPCS